MTKKTTITLSVIIGFVVLLIATITITSLIAAHNSKNQREDFLSQASLVDGIKHVDYEIQHPGVPWNTQLVIFAVLDIESSDQVAKEVSAIFKASKDTLGIESGVTIYIVNSSELDVDRYGERSVYFKDYLGGNDAENILEEAVKLIPGATLFENSVKITK